MGGVFQHGQGKKGSELITPVAAPAITLGQKGLLSFSVRLFSTLRLRALQHTSWEERRKVTSVSGSFGDHSKSSIDDEDDDDATPRDRTIVNRPGLTQDDAIDAAVGRKTQGARVLRARSAEN